MSQSEINFRRSLTIYEGGLIWVPGLEQETTTTSDILAKELAKVNLTGGSSMTVKEVLDLIPGAEVKFYDNFKLQNKEILLPNDDTDWYAVMRAYVSDRDRGYQLGEDGPVGYILEENPDKVARLPDILPPEVPQ